MTTEKKKSSTLSIIALTLSLIPFTFPIGGLLAGIDLTTGQKKNKAKDLSVASLVICGVYLLVAEGIFAIHFINRSSFNPREYKKSCEEVEYRKVARKPESYEGEDIVIRGEVIQVSDSSSNRVTLRIVDSESDGWDSDVWYVTYKYSDDDDRILEDDTVVVYGECTGVTSYKAVLGNTVTIPSIDAKIIEIDD